MKNIILSIVVIGMLFGMPLSIEAAPQTSLANLYKTGKITLKQELLITDENLPDEMFFENPREVTVDNEGNIYIVDYHAHHIKKFDAKGNFLKLLGREGEGPGEFIGPYRITFAKGRLIVYELNKRRLNTLDTDGNPIDSALIENTEGSLRGVRALPDGKIVLRRERTYLWYEDRPQNLILYIFSPELKSLGKIYEHEVLRNKYITKPERTNVPQPFFSDVCWTTTPDGKIVIGFSETYEIGLFDPEKGKLFSFSHDFKPVKVTNKDKDEWFGKLTYSNGGQTIEGSPEYVKKNTNFPTSKPPFHDIKVDPEGNILVFTPSLGEVFDFSYFDAFDPKGKFINRVEVVGDNSFQKNMPRLGKFFAAISTNEDDLYQVSFYTISK